MEQTSFFIGDIPAVLWGQKSTKLFLAIHGFLSNKEDVPMRILAEEAIVKGYQVLSFDLPEHGDRRDGIPFTIQACVSDLAQVLAFAHSRADSVSLLANSLGAYCSLLVCQTQQISQSLFLSPVVDMNLLLQGMMRDAGITEERLRSENVIRFPHGQTFYWQDVTFVWQHPVTAWSSPTAILCGGQDELYKAQVAAFASSFSCPVTIVEHAGYYFHTIEDLQAYRNWLKQNIAL